MEKTRLIEEWLPLENGTQVARFAVLVREYAPFIELNVVTQPLYWNEQIKYPNSPVVGISWNDASAFAVWVGCRLPSEQEWLKASTKFMWSNIWEWTSTTEGSDHVVRGGSWNHFAWFALSACRVKVDPVERFDYIGFRLVRSEEGEK